jgi:tRNA threonylcarbamoyladenosine biosynthesis protein TsaB
MRVLALDTTTREGSVALVEDGRVIAEHTGDPSRSHAERLPGDLTRALAAGGWTSSSVDLFAVVAGPGSFTGLRIGIATVQGLAFVHGRQVVGVSTLEALAHAACATLEPDTIVGAWADAHRHEVFSALYRVRDAPPFSPERLVEVDAPRSDAPAVVLEAWAGLVPRVDVCVGSGAALYADLLRPVANTVRTAYPLAAAAGLIAEWHAKRGRAIDPSALHPFYVRRPDVEVARERAFRGATPI